MGIIAAGQITVVDLSDAPVLNAFITASGPTTQTYSNDSRSYNPSYASTPQVLTLNVTKSGSTTSIIDSIRGLQWFVVDGSVKTEITSKDNASNEYISGNYNEKVTTKLNIDTIKGYRCYEATGVWHDPSTNLDVQFTADINLLLTQNGATGPQGPQGDEGPQGPQGDKGETGNGIANTVVTYGLSMTDTTEPATWSSDRPALVKGMYLWIRTVIIYTNGESTTSYQISYIPKDGDASGEIDKTKQELLEKLETVRDDSLAAVEEAKQQLGTVRDESLAAAEEAKQQVTTVANELNTAKQNLQNAVSAVDTKATNLKSDLSQAKQDLASQRQQLQEQATAQSELTNRVSSVEETANGTKTSVSELSKTVAQNGKNITSVTARTKVVEDDLAGTKTTLSQVKMTADSTSQKTATLETGLDGLSAKFENLKVGSRNYFKDSKSRKYYIDNTETQDVRTFIDDDFWKNDTRFTKDYVRMSFDIAFNPALPSDFTTNVHFSASPWYNCGGITFKGGTTDLQHFDLKFNLSGASKSYKTDNVFIRLNNTLPLNTAVSLENFNLYLSAVVEDYSQNGADLEQKVAEYKQNADQNYASLQSTVQNLDGTVQHNKTVADQTAQGFRTRIESLETYKDGESTRANKYFELAKNETARQLTVERTAIAKDYVAKSTYTSDVTGIRNELSATTATANTIKTNLANYQATNDRAVASLQSSMQTANGNISSLKTKVEAVPGQITSAVSAVESKIPTNVSTRNLILKSNDFANPHKQNGANTTVTSTDEYFVVKSTGYTANGYGGMSWNLSISEVKAGEEFSVLMPVYIDSSVNLDNGWALILKNHSSNSAAYDYNIPTNKKDQWFNVAITFKAYKDVVFDNYPFYVCLVKNGLVRIKPPMLVRGNLIPRDYQPAFEDTQTEITNLNTTLTQTANGLKQLSTQVTSQGGTITSHTNSINSLTTGLQAKVSQSDFNTLSGRVTTAENNITAKANELSSKITSVEGKIPTNVSTRNLILKSNDFANPHKATGDNTTVTSTNGYFVIRSTGYTANGYGGMSWNMSISEVKAGEEFSVLMPVYIDSSVNLDNGWALILKNHSSNSAAYDYNIPTNKKDQWFNVAITFKAYKDVVFDNYPFYVCLVKNGLVRIKPPMLVRGNLIPRDYQPAFEDAASDITKLNTTLTQTADGLRQLSTRVTSQGSTINTHTTQISALNTGLQAKVSQSDFNTLSGRVTTAENNIIAKANELSSKITTVEGKIPSGEMNLVEYGRPADGYSPYRGAEYATHPFYYNNVYKMYIIRNTSTNEKIFGMNRFKVERNTDYTLYFKGFNNNATTNMDVYFLKRVNGSNKVWDSAQQLVANRKLSASRAEDVSVTFNTGNYDEGYIRFDNNGTTTAGISADLYFGDVSVKKGKSNNGWSPSLAELASSQDLKNAQSEFKQTTDSIKASVTSLNNSTVKSSSLTINSDGIVMKAGKSTTDVANAIGSYFSVNQNAINLFADKIKVKGNMIVAGSISSDKIAASGITANVIKGGTLQSTNGSTNFELNTGKLFYNNNNTGVFRIQNGASTMGLKFSNTPVTVSGTSRILSRVIIGGDRRQTTLDDGKWDQGGFTGIVAETINGVGSDAHESADALRVIGDNIYFTHTYNKDVFTNAPAQGWKMETYAPFSSYTGTVVLKPYGVHYRNSNIVTGDLRLDNGDGSGYWVRTTINILKNCFFHIINGGTSSQATNAIRSELNKISGI